MIAAIYARKGTEQNGVAKNAKSVEIMRRPPSCVRMLIALAGLLICTACALHSSGRLMVLEDGTPIPLKMRFTRWGGEMEGTHPITGEHFKSNLIGKILAAGLEGNARCRRPCMWGIDKGQRQPHAGVATPTSKGDCRCLSCLPPSLPN